MSNKENTAIPIQRRAIVRIIILVISATALCIFLCVLSSPYTYSLWLDQATDHNVNAGDFYPEDYYKIDPNKIISSIEQGNLDIFSPTIEPNNYWPDSPTYFQWHQSDFLKIATALNKYAGKDDISDWNMLNVWFDTVCEDSGKGFSTGYISLYRPIWVDKELHYEAREIFIAPLANVVSWGSEKVYPRPLFGWNKIEIDKFKITAEEALKIADENGGKQARLDRGNKCSISVIGKMGEWHVIYEPFTEYYIDAYTGKTTYIRNDYKK